MLLLPLPSPCSPTPPSPPLNQALYPEHKNKFAKL